MNQPTEDQPTIEVPNFDAMTRDELRAFWGKYHLATRRHAREFLKVDRSAPVSHALVRGLQTLAAYALDKSVAMGLREKGEIQRALTYEQHCELRYESLPSMLRW